MPYVSICKKNQTLPAWFERTPLYRTMQLNLRPQETGVIEEGRYHWAFGLPSHFDDLQQLSALIAEHPQLTTTWTYVDGEEGRGGSTYFTLSIDDEEIVSCDFRYDTYEFGFNLTTLNSYLNHRLVNSPEPQ